MDEKEVPDDREGSAIAGQILGGRFDMAVRARATWLYHTGWWHPDDEQVEDLSQYEARFER